MANKVESRAAIGSCYVVGATEFAIAADALKEHGAVRSVIPLAFGLLFSYLASEKLWHRTRARQSYEKNAPTRT